ncbi:4736_t:CDS:2 [Funneliformis geosporum]|uniref:4736_t:CDS:1 n=1 Tax=Funneliformis geosporum TaxID=1117311 RepID=A0A9W4X283_9GLOM|nr:4736_t:CDS:2 [Funneliformis geosporum]
MKGLNLDEKFCALKEFASDDIADALMKLNVPYGGFLPDIVMYGPERQAGNTKLIGPAYTIKTVLRTDTTSPRPKQHFADAAPPGSVVFVSVPPNTVNAAWGGLMTARVKAKGANGIVVDGRIRDLAEIREEGIPAFAKGTSSLSAKDFIRPTALNHPVTLNGNYDPPIVIRPGDIIFGDLDGVICIPRRLLDTVIEMCKVNKKIDAGLKEQVKKGISLVEIFAMYRIKWAKDDDDHPASWGS